MATSGVTWGLTDAERDLFLAEAEEFLGALEAGALEIEQGPTDPELLNLMFRAAHTLKGNAGMAGLSALSQCTHELEQQLDDLRAQRVAPTPTVVQTILSAVDEARQLLRDFAQSEHTPGDESPPPAPARQRRARPARRSGGKTAGAEAATPDAPAGVTAFMLEVPDDCAMPAVRLFQAYQALARAADLVSAHPAQEQLAQYGGRTAEVRVRGMDAQNLRAALMGVPDVILRALPQADADANAEATPFRGSDLTLLQGQSQMVRVRVDVLDDLMNLVGELVIDRARIAELQRRLQTRESPAEEIAPELGRTTQHLGRVSQDLQKAIMQARMLPVDNLFRRLPRLVRDLSAQAGRDARIEVSGADTELDRMVLDELGDALTHLLRNAVDHGIEPPEERERLGKPRQGLIRISAAAEEGQIVVSVSDDGRGIDPEAVRRSAVEKGLIPAEDAALLDEAASRELIFAPGFSTSQDVTEISGRGVGLDAVRSSIEKVSGGIECASDPGVGSTFRLRIPLTLAIMRALLVASGHEVYALPLGTVQNIVRLTRDNVFDGEDRPVLSDRGSYIGVASLRRTFEVPGEGAEPFGVVLSVGQRRMALAVEQLLGEQEVVLKPLGKFLGTVPGIIGAALLPSGDIALVADVRELVLSETRR